MIKITKLSKNEVLQEELAYLAESFNSLATILDDTKNSSSLLYQALTNKHLDKATFNKIESAIYQATKGLNALKILNTIKNKRDVANEAK